VQMTMSDPGDLPQYRACHIVSDHPVNVQFFSKGVCSGGSYLALATPALGKKYVAACYNDNPGDGAVVTSGSPEISEGVFLIVAAFPNTTVRISPNATTKGGHPGAHSGAGNTGVETPYSVTLNRGQCYLVKSGSADNGVDMSGSIIVSNKPIAVLSGHENADIGFASISSDQRDFMVEQMIPAEFWDTTGYVSIPLKDSQPADPGNEGAGENYRVYSMDTTATALEVNELGIGFRTLSSSKLQFPPTEKFDVTAPIDFRATNGRKFAVMMYDQRNFQQRPPFPAPSMMTIIPISRWKTSYLLDVPKVGGQRYEEYYINIIAQREDINNGIFMSSKGESIKPLKQVVNVDGEFITIPDHPELEGIRVKVFPGTYFLTCWEPFIAYSFGFRNVADDLDNPPDGDEWYSSYANPMGAMLSSGDPAMLRTVIDSQCTAWTICAFDDRKNDPGIRSVALLNDSLGIQYTPGKRSINCRIDPVIDPNNFGEVQFDGANPQVCFSIQINDPLSEAYAAFLITDNAGNVKLSELRYNPPVFTRIPNSPSFNFGGAPVNSDTCVTLSIKNSESLSHTVLSAKLLQNNMFTISSVRPSLPAVLKKNDSVSVTICYDAHDTLPSSNYLNVVIDCFTVQTKIAANGITGLITATDLDFGSADSGSSVSKTITISNIGKERFTLSKNWKRTGSKAFILTDSLLLPAALDPGQALSLRVSYRPMSIGNDTATFDWVTDIEQPYSQRIKSYSLLTARATTASSSVIQTADQGNLTVHPNPSSGRSIILAFDNDQAGENVNVRIFDVLGREEYNRNLFMQNEIEIPVMNLQNGIYYAQFTRRGRIYTKKFEIMR
ncbi:MAG: choice-of-anchor D domain-containing protein, partial [Bacteroidota bacterium]|nr:choice-of-anchor D domain-containing protein [Bacteroidota bacterium]